MKFKIILISALLMLLGCSLINGPNKPTPNLFENYAYPLEVGNSWTYERTFTYSNIQPDTVQLPVRKGSSIFDITEIDTINDSLEYYVLNAAATDSMIQGSLYTGKILLNNEADGLYIYASTGSSIPSPISPLLNLKEESIKSSPLNFSTVSAHNEEIKTLQYPIEIGEQWIISDTVGFSFFTEKVITRFEILKTTVGTFNCFVVEWILPVEDLTIIDYYSEIGLMKRVTIAKNITISDPNNLNLAIADITDEYLLVDFTQGK